MITLRTLAIGLALIGAGAARAQDALPGATVSAPPAAVAGAACCRVAGGTVVQLETTELVSSRDRKHGDRFGLRLGAPLVVDGRLVAPAGTPGVGEIVHADRARGGGKPGELILAARYLQLGTIQVPLHGMKLGATGKDNTRTSLAVATAIGPFALFIHGGEIEIPPGTPAQARIVADIDLPAQGNDSGVVANAAATPVPTIVTTAPSQPSTPSQESH